MKPLLLVCAGGAVGSGLRYLVSRWLAAAPGHLPWGTLLVNVAGSFLLALLVWGLGARADDTADNARLLLGTGLMGGFTTYSTFNAEVLGALERGQGTLALGYAALTLVAALLAGALGVVTARALFG